jgi:hypothetical protein
MASVGDPAVILTLLPQGASMSLTVARGSGASGDGPGGWPMALAVAPVTLPGGRSNAFGYLSLSTLPHLPPVATGCNRSAP